MHFSLPGDTGGFCLTSHSIIPGKGQVPYGSQLNCSGKESQIFVFLGHLRFSRLSLNTLSPKLHSTLSVLLILLSDVKGPVYVLKQDETY